MLYVILVVASLYAYRLFRRGIGESSDQAVKRIVDEAERLTGYVTPRRRWLKPALATVLCWVGLMATLTPVSPSLAIWVGGAVIALGAMAVAKALPDPIRIDPDDLDRELIDLLEQHS
jgi:hypothetical protein